MLVPEQQFPHFRGPHLIQRAVVEVFEGYATGIVDRYLLMVSKATVRANIDRREPSAHRLSCESRCSGFLAPIVIAPILSWRGGLTRTMRLSKAYLMP
jgi:hypothetical protein